ncbi:hypothetical protein QE152_g30390 [Popillia japonica]|uniref:DUF4485 domain-containing protein n=1 Tax=Popillia japonica TaxID=7064 RepID=A0AAW1JE04_POPJA
MSLKILIATYFHKNKETAGKKWFDGITRRNPQLSLRNPENVYFLFDILEKIVDKNKLSCDTISNVEESGFARAEIDVKGDCPLNINFTSHESIEIDVKGSQHALLDILEPKPNTESEPISMSSSESEGDDTVVDVCQTKTIENFEGILHEVSPPPILNPYLELDELARRLH